MGFNYISQLREDLEKVIKRCKKFFQEEEKLLLVSADINSLTNEKNNLGSQLAPFNLLQAKLSDKPETVKDIQYVIAENMKRIDEITTLLQEKEKEKKSIEASIDELKNYFRTYRSIAVEKTIDVQIAKSLNLVDAEEVAIARYLMTGEGGRRLIIPEGISETTINKYEKMLP